MNKFKVGDTVIRTTPNEGLTVGKEYMVLDVAYNSISVSNDNGNIHTCVANYFKLKETTPAITKEMVLEAAKCSTTKEALEKLFPGYFEEEFIINSGIISYKEYPYAKSLRFNDRHDLITVYAKQQGYKGFVLNSSYDWKIEEIDNTITLIPTRK